MAKGYISFINMDNYSDIISKRAFSGVMIFSAGKELIYVNEEAKRFLRVLMEEKNNTVYTGGNLASEMPADVCSLCEDLIVRTDGEKGKKNHGIYKNIFCGGEDFFLRAVPIHKISRDKEIPHVMITVERFSTRLTADIKKVGAKFGLTKRELEVLKGIARGMTNKKISGILFISEHTVKDHLRSIMQKMDVNNRSMLVCRVFESNQ